VGVGGGFPIRRGVGARRRVGLQEEARRIIPTHSERFKKSSFKFPLIIFSIRAKFLFFVYLCTLIRLRDII